MTESETLENTNREVVVETHFFTTLRYKDQADNGFSGNIAMLIEAIQHSDKVLDNDLKILAKGILDSVIKHKIIKHSTEDIKKACMQKREEEAKKEDNYIEVIENTEILVEN